MSDGPPDEPASGREALAPLVRAMARGPSRGRGLTQGEARDALGHALAGDAAPEAVGALFMLMRYRGESAAEIAGFVEALRARVLAWRDLGSDIPGLLDWPSYAAGRTRGLPLFLVAARLVAASGRPVLIHGWNSHLTHAASTLKGVEALGIPIVRETEAARAALAAEGVAYLPLDALDADALRLLRLREVLGLRSPINTALRAFNPGGAATSVQGVFHPPYRALQTDAARLLGQAALGVVKGGGGEFERHPGKAVELYGFNEAGAFDFAMPPTEALAPRRMRGDDETLTPESLVRLWSGEAENAFASAVVIATAGAALHVAGAGALADTDARAAHLWEVR